MNKSSDNKDNGSFAKDVHRERGLHSEFEATPQPREPIAIVGMSCRLPQARDLRAFWQLLRESQSVITEFPAERSAVRESFDPATTFSAEIPNRCGGFLDNLDSFDAAFFGISAREAPHVDPRQRVMLEVAWEALEDAGIDPGSLKGSKTGVYLATLNNDYDFLISRNYSLFESFTGAGTANSIVANRISYFLDLKGPSLTLDTACSGSLLTIEIASRSLLAGETNLALAGGVSVNLLARGDVFFSRAGALSPAGRCRAFDDGADGIVRSEGAGLIVLKRLSTALADRDRIYAVIRGGAINHNGRSNGIMAPNGLAQTELLRTAYKQAGVSPGKVQYVEAHGTGTRLGDPIEANSLFEVLATERSAGRACILGSVKTNVGHLEAAAGVVGVIKTALCLHHRQIVPTLHFTKLNPLINATSFPLRIAEKIESWPVEDEPLVAGVSSFGFGGTNAHLVLQESPRINPEQRGENKAAHILPLSAQSASALRAVAKSYQEFLASDGAGLNLEDICYTAGVRRGTHDHRVAVVGRSREELIAELEAFTRDEDTRASRSVAERRQSRKLVYVFSGQGTHWHGMGRQLMEDEPIFSRAIEECDRILRRDSDWSLIEQLHENSDESRLNETDVAQPAIFAVQIALAALWASWGIVPDAVVGQSLGEVAAAHVAGALSLADALQVVRQRSRLMKQMAGRGKTAVVGLSAQETQMILADFTDTLALAGSIGPTASVVSGEEHALGRVLQSLRARDVFCRELENVDVAFHSPQMNGIKPELTRALETITPRSSSVRFVSTVTETSLPGQELNADYWGRNLREPFRFAEVITNLIAEGDFSFLEIGPHPVLAGSIRQCLAHQGRQGAAMSSLARDQDERLAMLSSLARFYEEGFEIDWNALYPAGGRCVTLPSYRWQRERYWYDQLNGAAQPIDKSRFVAARNKDSHPLLGEHFQPALSADEQYWEQSVNLNEVSFLKDHRLAGAVVWPGAAFLEMALAAAKQTPGGSGAGVIEDLHFERALMLFDDEPLKLQLVRSSAANGQAVFQIYSRPNSSAAPANSWTLHVRGAMCATNGYAPSIADEISVQACRSKCRQPVSIDDHYAAMAALRLNYGPSFRIIEQLWGGEAEAVSRCVLPENLRAEADRYEVHPVLLDAGFQTVAAASQSLGQALYLPHRVAQVRVLHRLSDRAWVHARLHPHSEADPSVLTSDIRLFDDVGRVAVEIEGMCLKRFDTALADTNSNSKDWLYQVQWVPQARDGLVPQKSKDQTATYFVFTDGAEIGEQLTAIIERDSQSCIKVYPSDQYGVSRDKRSAWIDPHRPEQFQRLFQDALADNVRTPIVALHLWGMTGATEETTCAALESSHGLGCEALLHLAQGLASSNARASARLWVITRAAQPLGASSSGTPSFAQSGLWGLGRVIALEHPELWGGLIDLDSADTETDAELVYAEVSQRSEDREIAFSARERRVARLERMRPSLTTRAYQFRSDASYLITGGLSGLGLETARWMVLQGARRLILLARTPLPPRERWRELEATAEDARVVAVLELERLGASVQVYAVDVGDEIQLSSFFENYRRERWPPIRGIVHSAGIVKDQLLMRMDAQSLREVLAPKLYGGWLLHRLTKTDELDFFVMFSSASAVLGRAGQGNYAAANSFLDGLAHYRRRLGLPGLSINWGPWSEVGMYARAGLSKRAGADGVAEIAPDLGIELLSLLIRSDARQVMAVNADWNQFNANPLLSELIAAPKDTKNGGTIAGPTLVLEMLLAGEAERRTMLEAYLKKILGQVLRCDASRANPAIMLTSLGMDSIMAVELKNAIEADLNLNISLLDLFTESIAGIVEKLDGQLGTDERLAEVVTEIEQLSRDEVLAQLEREDQIAQQGLPGRV